MAANPDETSLLPSSSSSSLSPPFLSCSPPAEPDLLESVVLGSARILGSERKYLLGSSSKKFAKYLDKYTYTYGFCYVKESLKRELFSILYNRFPSPKFQPSEEQNRILDWIDQPSDQNIIIEACAGSGKTSTLALCASRILSNDWKERKEWPTSILYLTFSKELVADMISKQLFNVQAMTLHSLGRNLLKLPPPVESSSKAPLSIVAAAVSKHTNLITSTISDMKLGLNTTDRGQVAKVALNCLTDLLHSSQTDYSTFLDTWKANHRIPCISFENFEKLISFCVKNLVEEDRFVDYDAMVWLPRIRKSKVTKIFDWIFIDEVQDLNEAQICLISYLVNQLHFEYGRKPRIIAVGDPNQAIFSFQGALSDSFQKVATALDCSSNFCLSSSFRCPTAHFSLANPLRQNPGNSLNPEGSIHSHPWDLGQHISADGPLMWNYPPHKLDSPPVPDPSSLVICRNNLPIIQFAHWLVKFHRKPVTIVGFDFYQDLKTLLDASPEKRKLILSKCRDLAGRQKSLSKLQHLKDLESIIDWMLNELSEEERKKFFISPNDSSVIRCSTTHKAKGLEADSVYVIDPSLFNLQSSDPSNQDPNLLYVALTRSKKTLHLIGESQESLQSRIQQRLVGSSSDGPQPKRQRTVHFDNQ